MSVDLERNVVLRGEAELAGRARTLFLACEEFACAATDPNTWAMPGFRERMVAERRRAGPPPTTYKLYDPAALADEESERYLVEIAKAGARVRICSAPLPHETIIVDRRIAILAGPPPTPHPSASNGRAPRDGSGPHPLKGRAPHDGLVEGGLREYTVVRSPSVVKGIVSLFRASWETATDLADYRRGRPPALSEESRTILGLLAGGLKDEAAARRLDMSLRTYRRRVAEILTLLDAGSRFQAGLRAHEFGLIS